MPAARAVQSISRLPHSAMLEGEVRAKGYAKSTRDAPKPPKLGWMLSSTSVMRRRGLRVSCCRLGRWGVSESGIADWRRVLLSFRQLYLITS